ncbi:uncharacterized protein B0J16DRAFT_351787 [Fusarium flagelliforme]|uniref:uncharacterized protein n=1 Tax=Fusarium flagelliforme TaxID=2675880 RepID=UPI001E8D35C1|nr:uncharacterized protein B0J16DRAFT_351787 [Fusarium flagelliforme]KAH7169641.1 hypothetical protein B0J16DRAFT_351787 [Fusarium flagelliforme]
MHLLLRTTRKNKDNPRIVLVYSGIQNRSKSRLIVDAKGTRLDITTNSWYVPNAPALTGSAASAA